MVFTVCATCFCTLCLRKRLVALSRCCSFWRKKKTTSDKDIEKGKRLLKFKRTKPAVTTSMLQNRARSLSEDYVDRGIQNVELSVAREMTPPIGCCACCKKKRKQKRNK
ncbi:uncharacterized protein [Chelonus insularis]|uniref:uncharacterized protein n=1 Tax=Chelonus insularis TaxID=460826 RepID=UPI00158A377A|nr:uncharacterized protein LOC118065877 [Chelonus insularis]